MTRSALLTAFLSGVLVSGYLPRVVAADPPLSDPKASDPVLAQALAELRRKEERQKDPVGAMTRENQFAADLFTEVLKKSEGNVLISPSSIRAVLGMLHGGAKGPTQDEIATALRWKPEFGDFHTFHAAPAPPPHVKPTGKPPLVTANGLWAAGELQPEFVALVKSKYAGEARSFDPAKPEAAREEINKWVGKNSDGKIDDLLPGGSITPDTRVVLANATAFEDTWVSPFDKAKSRKLPFHVTEKQEVEVVMMRQELRTRYAKGDGWEAVRLFFDSFGCGATLVLPSPGTRPEDLAPRIAEIAAQAHVSRGHRIDLTLPKFAFQTQSQMKNPLKAMGVKEAFTRGADFSPMTGHGNVFVDEIHHQARIELDEVGVKAVVATGARAIHTSRPIEDEIIPLAFDRPFLVAITHYRTGVIVFLGRIDNPAK